MISLSTIIGDLQGNIILDETLTSKVKTNTSRVVLIPTLDGKSVSIHSGVTDMDRPVKIKAKISKEKEELIWSFFNTKPYLLLMVNNELFLISIKSLSTDNGILTMSILVINKEN